MEIALRSRKDLQPLYVICGLVQFRSSGLNQHSRHKQSLPRRLLMLFSRDPLRGFQKGLPLLRNGGSIVLVSSAAHLKGIPFYVTYSATKAVMRSFARSCTGIDLIADGGITQI
jgi:NAD(P)-dependent dehydrogenase (short-subunit alcohol dehydrogenase family)